MGITNRNITANQGTFDSNRQALLLYDTKTIDGTYKNISGAAQSVAIGTVMGRVKTTGNLIPCKSDATDGSQYPVGLMLDEIVEAAANAEVKISLVNGGCVNKNMIAFAKEGDSFDTVVSDKRFIDRLVSDTAGLKLEDVADGTKFDN